MKILEVIAKGETAISAGRVYSESEAEEAVQMAEVKCVDLCSHNT